MTKQKSTKRALLMSALSLLLCVSMLIGSTFAWFTDSVTSGNNKIVAGNLDIELEYWNGTEWKDVKDASDILTNALWEPGVTEVAYLRVANAGSLVLKYQLGINILNEIAGKNQANETFKLSDYIMFGVVEGVNGETGAYTKDDAGRAAAIADVTAAKKISAGYTKAATMDPDDELYLALVVYMPTDVNNVANHNGTDIPQIDLGINVYATQMTAESDSFGPDYDKDSAHFVSTADELRNAIATAKDGGTVYVNDGIYNIDSQIDIAGKSINIVGVGENAVIHMADKRINYNKIFYIYGSATEGEDITVNISNVTLTSDIPTKSDIWIRTDTKNGAKVSGNVNVNLDKVTCTSIICDNNYVNGDTINLKINNSNVKKVALDASPFNGNGLNTYTNLTHNASRIDSINIQSGVNDLTHIKINGVNPTAHGEQQTLKYISTAEELAALGGTKINGTYVLMADIDMSGYEMKPIMLTSGATNTLTFNGNGHTISNLTLVQDYQNGMYVAGLFNILYSGAELNVNHLTLSNVKSTSDKYAAAVVAYNSTTLTINLNDVDVDGATVTAETVAGLVSYSTGLVNLTDCDVSGLVLTGEKAEKIGAYVGTANTASCNVTVANCANNTAYGDYGRVINGARWNGALIVSAPIEVPVAPLEEDFLFPAGTDAVLYKDMVLTGDAQIVHEKNAVLGLSNVTADLDHDVIIRKSSSGICISDCNFTLTDGAKLISVGEGGDAYQVFMVNVTINGVLMDDTTIWNYVEGISYISIVPEWPNT